MNATVRNILAVIAGLLVGGIVNMAIIMKSGSIIPPPAGADLTTEEGLKAAMHLMEPKHFLMPFLAHSLGTFVGAGLTAFLAATRKMRMALIIGIFSLVGGGVDCYILPAPMWFIALDLLGAYIPVAYLAGKLFGKENSIANE